MYSLAALRNHIPPQFDKHVDKLTSRLSPQPPPEQEQEQPPTQAQGAADEYYDSSQEAWSQYPAPSATKTLELAPKGHSMIVSTSNGKPLLTITFASSSSDEGVPDLLVFRGNGAGDEVASAQFHRWAQKTDLHYNGKKIKIKKDFESSAGLGKAKWEKEGRRAMKLKAGKDVVARFEAVGKGKRKKGTGQFEIFRDGLTRNQLEEVVISCLVERERMRRNGELDGEILQEGAWELFMASLGL
ncbi:hypothetical protein HD806DRAFT_491136 [Xylariaceae sp. AK1471]|nr:hypothetical protein HD806DRAFT_491136 [Xylariaceae sp. AK1471]